MIQELSILVVVNKRYLKYVYLKGSLVKKNKENVWEGYDTHFFQCDIMPIWNITKVGQNQNENCDLENATLWRFLRCFMDMYFLGRASQVAQW